MIFPLTLPRQLIYNIRRIKQVLGLSKYLCVEPYSF